MRTPGCWGGRKIHPTPITYHPVFPATLGYRILSLHFTNEGMGQCRFQLLNHRSGTHTCLFVSLRMLSIVLLKGHLFSHPTRAVCPLYLALWDNLRDSSEQNQDPDWVSWEWYNKLPLKVLPHLFQLLAAPYIFWQHNSSLCLFLWPSSLSLCLKSLSLSFLL